MLLPHPAIDIEHANSKSMSEETTKKLTLSFNPKKPRVLFPHAEPLVLEKPGAGVDLTFIACFIPIPGAVRCSQPLANPFRWVNWTYYYQFLYRRLQFKST
jgi:hypothetical protein